ncbi:3-dehydroquinate synthase [Dysosmobacter sp.]|uniref:3-dehydroquinate synthase n=1 Tax=Dysosmobacter sp. TaxID=2591382 RepID=UPI002A8C845A|nr:3-dehydroquinate synthase [Dysosmobacter sp.]MDY3282131.1 3-dehydroquinate synthase [Dysosmobacter sp.]
MSNCVNTIRVHVDPPYTVTIGSGLLARCGELLRPVLGECRLCVAADSNVAPLYLDTVTESLRSAGYTVSTCLYPAGEAHKNLETLSGILEFLAAEHLTRSDCVVALGGGVCGDMAGFAAGCYLRGIRYVQLPTTLLSAVDSSVGGKTAIDLKAGKNLAGVFLQPAAVLCDTDCLRTLPPEVFADGAAEAIKTGVLSDETLFSLFDADDLTDRLPEIIARCIAFKAKVVEEDELDNGVRRTLNLGHTAGHAIEKCADFRLTHGHAVAIGMVIMARAAEKLGWCTEPSADRIAAMLRRNRLPVSTEFSASELAAAALSDKKRRGDSISVVVPDRIGSCYMKKVSVNDLEAIFRAGLEG